MWQSLGIDERLGSLLDLAERAGSRREIARWNSDRSYPGTKVLQMPRKLERNYTTGIVFHIAIAAQKHFALLKLYLY